MNREYKILSDIGEAYFIEMETVPSDFEPSWDQEEMEKNKISLLANDAIIIKEVFDNGIYSVQLSNGKTGVLYFWIGD